MYRLLIPHQIWGRLDRHLREAAPSEDGAFFLVRSGRGSHSTRLIVHELLLPGNGAWESRGRHRLRPSAQWLSAVIGAAIESNSGVGFVHSHPDVGHPPTLSHIDRTTSIEWSRSLTPSLQNQFLSLVWTPSLTGGLVFEPNEPDVERHLDRIEIVGEGRSAWVHELMPDVHSSTAHGADMDDRQVRALGELGNARLRSLTVAVVGAGGTGSPMAEQLARIGVERLIVIDPDRIDSPSNLRRVVGSHRGDLDDKRLKVDVVARHVRSLDLDVDVIPVGLDVRRQEAGRALLDADLVISTTDTHSSRSLVNQLAHQYLLPTIDVGIKVGTSQTGAVTGMPTDIRVLLPDGACLWCMGVLDAGRVREENLPPDERATLALEGYVQGVTLPQASLAPLNYFAASLTLLTMLRLFASDGVLAPQTLADGWEHYFADRAVEIRPGCVCNSWRAMGDEVEVSYLPSPRAGV